MNHYVYARRRLGDISALRFKLNRLMGLLNSADFKKMHLLLDEVEGILKKYR
ncbi:MAG: hypothetical protein KGH49_01245 [Candidatus Micrarchaeota archaeon]|nr:hypothetical protein [Candidatus Micrarchaeota archaeon]